MSYAEAKEIALLRLELRACWDREDRIAGRVSALRLAQVAGTTTSSQPKRDAGSHRFAG